MTAKVSPRPVSFLPEGFRSMVAHASFPTEDGVTVCGGKKRYSVLIESCYVFDLAKDAWRDAPFHLLIPRSSGTGQHSQLLIEVKISFGG